MPPSKKKSSTKPKDGEKPKRPPNAFGHLIAIMWYDNGDALRQTMKDTGKPASQVLKEIYDTMKQDPNFETIKAKNAKRYEEIQKLKAAE